MSTQHTIPDNTVIAGKTLSPNEMSDEELREYGFEILKRELGVAGLARFLSANQAKTGDYTRDRHQWQKGITVQHILDEIDRERELTA